MPNALPDSTPPAMASRAERLAQAFNLIARDLSNPWDEGTDRFFPFHAAMADNIPLDAPGLREALGVSERFQLDIGEPNLDEVADNWGDDNDAAGYRLLDRVMRAALTDVRLVFARAQDVVRVRVWLLGRLPGGGLVGLRSESTET